MPIFWRWPLNGRSVLQLIILDLNWIFPPFVGIHHVLFFEPFITFCFAAIFRGGDHEVEKGQQGGQGGREGAVTGGKRGATGDFLGIGDHTLPLLFLFLPPPPPPIPSLTGPPLSPPPLHPYWLRGRGFFQENPKESHQGEECEKRLFIEMLTNARGAKWAVPLLLFAIAAGWSLNYRYLIRFRRYLS